MLAPFAFLLISGEAQRRRKPAFYFSGDSVGLYEPEDMKSYGQRPGALASISRNIALVVKFQEVVHSIWIREAGCDEQTVFLKEIEWTTTRMPD